jgi:GT2 family glycosyltransferase
MITIICSSQHNLDSFKEHIINLSGLQKNEIQFLGYLNNGEFSLSEIYNKGIIESTNDYLVCVHDDIRLEKNWGVKLLKDFNDNPGFSIIGKAGSCYFPESGIFWERMQYTMVGQVYHHPKDGKKFLSKYSPKLPFLVPVVTIDGLFIAFNKRKIKYNFDETLKGFHFYDHGFCLPNYLSGVKIGVTSSFEITHNSLGKPNETFFETKEKFVDKYKGLLPLDLKPNSVYYNEVKNKVRNSGKVAVIIPTKGNLELLFQCVDSFFLNCDSNTFDIIIADTGSTKKELLEIKERYSNRVNLVEYNYYNFAKINNDVVKNLDCQYEYLLFCNNDIKLLNDVVSGMLKVFKENKKAGTVGCRLHFKDNTIQHDGVFSVIHKEKRSFNVSHINLNNYYNYKLGLNEVIGSTAALLMIRKNTFINAGMFNENYNECFEDVELNMKLVTMGYKNYCHSDLVAYHYESQTRNQDVNKNDKLMRDYNENLLPFFNQNINKLKEKTIFI